MENNLDQFAHVIPEEHTALIKPEAIPALLDFGAFKSSAWQETRDVVRDFPDNGFFKGTFSPIRDALAAGKLEDPPKAVDEIADKLFAMLTLANTSRRRRRFDGDDGDLNITRYIDDRDDRLFTRRRRTLTQAPTVNVIAGFSFPASDNIARFHEAAAALCAVSQLLESTGYSANIYAQQHVSTNGKAGFLVQIKTAGTPINISQIWTYSRPEVSRRIFFMLLTQLNDRFNLRHNPNIGYPEWPTAAQLARITGDKTNIFIPPRMIQDTKNKPAALASMLQRLIDETFNNTNPQED